jgi:hypothetical protein
MLLSDFLRRNVVLSFQEDAIGIRLPRQHDVGLGLSAQRVDVSPIAQDLGGDPGRGADDEQARIADGSTARVYNFEVARLTSLPEVATGVADPGS